MDPPALFVGKLFSSYSELKDAIQDYQNANYVLLKCQDSRTLQTAFRQAPLISTKAKPDLIYYFINYSCIHGGKKVKSRSKGCRPNQLTQNISCPMKMTIRLTEDYNFLKVHSLLETHNHDLSAAAFGLYSRNRKLLKNNETEDQCLMDNMDNLECNKKSRIIEKDIRAFNLKFKTKSLNRVDNSYTSRYQKHLTVHAFNILTPQLNIYENIQLDFDEHTQSLPVTYISSEGSIQISSNHCQCSFFVSNGLPCRHIFALRKLLDLDLFDEALLLERWTKEYYKRTHRAVKEGQPSHSPQIHTSSARTELIPKQFNHRLKNAKVITDKVAYLVALSCDSKYTSHLNVLTSLLDYWKNVENGELSVCQSSDDKV